MYEENGNDFAAINNGLTENIQKVLTEAMGGGNCKKYSRFVLAALGSIPWVGGFLAASSAIDAENEQGKVNNLTKFWLKGKSSQSPRIERNICRDSYANSWLWPRN